MKLFFDNISEQVKIPMDFPLEAVLEQALEVFDQLPEDDGSSFGIVNEQNIVVQFYKFNAFMWMVEIPDHSKHGIYQAICNRGQCIRIIEDLFSGADAMTVAQFKFESYL
ncbi:hypothetical protein [Moheibacter stercoris]|uniref:Uncharacterized protein n=1 Tax=Moheibacter stercoris TaxID=1628251 RepID=A0ABV2LX56_9FLAO